MKEIDIAVWNRRKIYENFLNYTNPQFNISARLDVTALHGLCKKTGISFFTAMTFIVAKRLNEIEEFRYRIRGEKVVVYDRTDPSFVIKSDCGSISSCRVPYTPSFPVFYPAARRLADEAKAAPPVFNNDDKNDMFFISCMPWLDITGFTNPYDCKNREQTSIPRIMWSRFVQAGDRWQMTFDIAVHHALMDGESVCRAINAVQEALIDAENFLR